MKQSQFLNITIVTLLSIFFVSCVSERKEKTSVEAIKQNPGLTDPNDKYKVILSTDSIINLGEIGILDIWIGSQEESFIAPGNVQDEKEIKVGLRKYTKIIPDAKGFEIIDNNKNKCLLIDPSGSNVRFSLNPKREGKYRVSANIELYKTKDCSDTPIPKIAQTLSVIVKVDKEKERSKKAKKLWDIAWENFLKFWGALIALLFGLILFLIRRKIRRRTGFEEPSE